MDPAGATTTTESDSARRMRPEIVLWLAGASALVVFLALEPYLSFALFGSDTGEYFRLTSALVTTGHLPLGSAYLGWGTAYPDFPGIFLLSGASAGALGLSPLSALTWVIPSVAALSILPLFQLFRRLYPRDSVALLGATLATVAMPRMFSLAHPAPLALGDFLCVAGWWMLVESRRDRRWFFPLGLASAALVVTHHLSTYLFVVGGAGGIVLLELWRPRLWSGRFPAREWTFLAALSTATLAYWFYGAPTFVSDVLVPGLGSSPLGTFVGLESVVLLAFLGTGALLLARRRVGGTKGSWVRVPTTRSLARDALIIGLVVFGAIGVLVFVPLPGTSQTVAPAALLWFAPLLGAAMLAAGSRRALTTARLGPWSLTLLGAIGLSAIATLLLAEVGPSVAGFVNAIPPSRHAEYLFIPLGLLLAVGGARLALRAGDRGGRRALLAASIGLVVLVAANAAIVYPPPSDFGGFQEGLTHGDAALWMWIGLGVPITFVIASDHRLSSMIFGFDGNRATWDSTPALFTGSNFSAALAELNGSDAPHSIAPINAVAVDATMYTGVALNP